jgi:hypothetical protein
MNAANASANRAHSRHTADVEAEKVSLRRIRLVSRRQHITANVGTFLAADKVLLSWAGRTEEPVECEFEIIYADGHPYRNIPPSSDRSGMRPVRTDWRDRSTVLLH